MKLGVVKVLSGEIRTNDILWLGDGCQGRGLKPLDKCLTPDRDFMLLPEDGVFYGHSTAEVKDGKITNIRLECSSKLYFVVLLDEEKNIYYAVDGNSLSLIAIDSKEKLLIDTMFTIGSLSGISCNKGSCNCRRSSSNCKRCNRVKLGDGGYVDLISKDGNFSLFIKRLNLKFYYEIKCTG